MWKIILKGSLLIDVAAQIDENTYLKTCKNLSKYNDLEIEIRRMSYLNAKTLPVVTVDLRLILKGVKRYVD